jgi:hypothetical protein
MKRVLVICCLIAATVVLAFAAKPSDFSGTWSLDLSKSKLPQMGGPGGGGGMGGSPITAQTITIKQDEKTISIETKTEGGMGGGGTQTVTYNLDGTETKTEMTGRMGTIPITLKAKVNENGSLEFTRVSKFTTPDGTERTNTTKETWEITDGGKGLKIHRVSEGRNGNVESDWVYAKK